jgi:hypothetical protein
VTDVAGSAAHLFDGRPSGELAVLRYITRAGLPGMSWACRVVQDQPDLLALYIPRGATYMRWELAPDGRRRLAPARWRDDVLRLMFPGEPYSIWLFFQEQDGVRQFARYYVNMEEPFRRTRIGFDTNDHTLDILIDPGFGWRWKDEDEFSERTRTGIYLPEFAAETKAHAERVLGRAEARLSPFSDGWERWVPDERWSSVEMPPGWDTEPAVLWERRHWAYGDASA